VKFYAELELHASGPLDDARLSALADELFELDASDPVVEDMDVTAAIGDEHVTVAMCVDAEDPAQAATKALCVVRTAIHAIGGGTPGWETSRTVLHVAPSDAADRLLSPA
jgi:hypothetical protein